MSKLTTREIARMAGVSPTAVSFALNGKEGISAETRRKILDIVQKNGYEPTRRNRQTRARTLRYNRIAIISARTHYRGGPLSYMFYSELREPIIELCTARNIDVVIANVSELGWEYRVPNTLMFEDVDGVIVLGDIPQMYLDKFRSMHLPLLELDPSYAYPEQKAIRIDFRHAVCLATQHLLDLGHRDIAYFGGGKLRDQNLQAFAGFQETMSAISQPLDLCRIQMDLTEDMVKSAVDVQLDSHPRPTAIVCTADCLAIAAMQHLQERGMRVPEDISLVTINDITPAQLVSPTLSAVHVDTNAIAKLAFDTLMRQINHEEVETIVHTPSELVQRGSSSAPNEPQTKRL